jgi:allantoicase
MMEITDLVDLASERVGGVALAASDEFFAPKESLLRPSKPVFRDDEYTDRGKWMDGWETRRAFGRVPGHTHDWCVVELGLPGSIAAVDVDTRFFRGNYPEACSLEGCRLAPGADAAALASAAWEPIVPKSRLRGDSTNLFVVQAPDERGRVAGLTWTHLRLNIFPDGGVARLRVFGAASPDWATYRRLGGPVDLASLAAGGAVVACSDMFFGSRHNLIQPGRAANMGDGWETQRKRAPGHDWVVVRLGARAARVRGVVIDTLHFKGNCPESAALEAIDDEAATVASLSDPARRWSPLLARTRLRPHTSRTFSEELEAPRDAVTHVRLTIFPDGGVSRLRVLGDLPARPSA